MQITYLYFNDRRLKKASSPDLGYVMYIFAGFMLTVAIIAWLYIPKVQEGERKKPDPPTCIPGHIVPNKALEDLAEGRPKENEEDRVGFKERTAALRKRWRAKWRN